MPRLTAAPLTLSDAERTALQKLTKRPSAAQQVVLRARIVLLADEGKGHGEIARTLNISKEMARRWRARWLALSATEASVEERLQDAPRPGAPPTFTLEQIAQLHAIASMPPEHYGRPIAAWTAQELADEMVNQQVVEAISPRHVGRLLQEADLKRTSIATG